MPLALRSGGSLMAIGVTLTREWLLEAAVGKGVEIGPGPLAVTEIQWWHAMTGANNDRVNALAKRFSDSQSDYKVTAVYKGSYPEAMAGAIAAYRAGNVLLARGRTFEVVTQVSVGHAWLRLRDSLEGAATAWYLAELADRSLEERHAAEHDLRRDEIEDRLEEWPRIALENLRDLRVPDRFARIVREGVSLSKRTHCSVASKPYRSSPR